MFTNGGGPQFVSFPRVFTNGGTWGACLTACLEMTGRTNGIRMKGGGLSQPEFVTNKNLKPRSKCGPAGGTSLIGEPHREARGTSASWCDDGKRDLKWQHWFAISLYLMHYTIFITAVARRPLPNEASCFVWAGRVWSDQNPRAGYRPH